MTDDSSVYIGPQPPVQALAAICLAVTVCMVAARAGRAGLARLNIVTVPS